MNGVIIFADDDVLKSGRPENNLFNTFINSEDTALSFKLK